MNKYRAMLVAAVVPDNWGKETLLMRFVEENGASTPFYLTAAAKEQFKGCEQWKIYEMTFAGKCVRTTD